MISAFQRVATSAPSTNVRLYKTVRATTGMQTLKKVHHRQREMVYNIKKAHPTLHRQSKKSIDHGAPKDDLELPMVKYKLDCPGCGAKYQHRNSEKPGYLPYETMVSWDAKSPIPCERCNVIQDTEYHKMYSIDEGRFKKIISKIASRRSVGVVVCDVVGFPGTLPPDIEKIYPPHTPVILCLNKCDVLASSPKQLSFVQEYYMHLIAKWEKATSFSFNEIMFTSARTGTGIPELSLLIQKYIHDERYGSFDFCYFIGMTNAGKSTMFNKLSPLLSNNMRCIGNVTESPLLGTTVKDITSPIDRPKISSKYPDKVLSKQITNLKNVLSTQNENLNDGKFSEWFRSQIDLQLADKSGMKMIVDTPGVLPDNSIPEATFTCQSEVTSETFKLFPGEVLSCGWYKIYYIRGNTQMNLRVNSPVVSIYKKHHALSDNTLTTSPIGTTLQNKLYVMYNTRNEQGPVGDIVLGNIAWVSVTLGLGDDATVCVLGPRLDDMSYRTPAFGIKLRRADGEQGFGDQEGLSEHDQGDYLDIKTID